MRLLFVVAHPKHIHFIKNLIDYAIDKGIDYKIVAVDKDIVKNLLTIYGYSFDLIGSNKGGMIRKLSNIPRRFIRVWKIVRKFKPTFILGQADPLMAVVGRMQNQTTIFFPDSEGAFLSRNIAFPVSRILFVPVSYFRKVRFKHIRLNHYLELAYLHPKYFKKRRPAHKILGLDREEEFIVIRLVSWEAHHDIGQSGLSRENKMRMVKEFSEYARVYISSEKELPEELSEFQINIPPERMHEVLAGAKLFFGESATMATESAVLGTPAIYLDQRGTGYTHELEYKFDLLYNFTDSDEGQNQAIEKAIEILGSSESKPRWKEKREKMLAEKINTTEFIIWFIQNYPESLSVMKDSPEYQNRFH